MRLGRGNRKC